MASSVIIPKKSVLSGAVPSSGSLSFGEIAINHADKKLYAKHPNGTVQEIGSLSAHSHDELYSLDNSQHIELQDNGTLVVTAGSTSKTLTLPGASGTLATLDDITVGGVTSVNTYTGAVTLDQSDIGLSDVDNTSDADKPISTAAQTALAGKASTSHTHNELNSLNSTKQIELQNNGDLTLPNGGTISDSAVAEGSLTLTPPNAGAGQGLVVRPTVSTWSITSSGYIVYGSPITISVTLGSWAYFGTVNYTISGTGVTEQSLGRALTGKLTFVSTSAPDTETITWTIPANSNITEFTLTLTSVDGTLSTDISTENNPALYYNFEYNGLPTNQFVTVTNNGITNSEHSHVHLISADPSTVDIYLGDDDQYVKIERNAGGVVIGNNSNTKQWNFKTDGVLELPAGGDITISGSSVLGGGGGGVQANWSSTSGPSSILNKPTLAAVATSGSYADLSNTPTLGTAAATASTDYATAAQGTTADSALQASALTPYRTSAAQDIIDTGKATSAQGAKADSALQPLTQQAAALSGLDFNGLYLPLAGTNAGKAYYYTTIPDAIGSTSYTVQWDSAGAKWISRQEYSDESGGYSLLSNSASGNTQYPWQATWQANLGGLGVSPSPAPNVFQHFAGGVLLSDLQRGTAASGHVIAWNGTAWAPSTPAAAGVSSVAGRTGAVTLTLSDVPNAVGSVTTGIAPATRITNMMQITLAGYNAITPAANTLYIIVG
jgi:hypothetical protein